MSRAFALIPNFSVSLDTAERVPFHADPILAAIERHEEAVAVFRAAPAEAAVVRASYDMGAAAMALLGTPCATRQGAFCLLRHLRWWLDEQADEPEPSVITHIAIAREADLALLLGCDGVRRIPVALPLGRLASVPVLPEAPGSLVIDAGPARAPALVRLGRAASSAGEVLAALVIIVGGCGLVGLASLF